MIELQSSLKDEARHALPTRLIHDLRTPLNQIIGYSELLVEQSQEAGHNDLVPDLQRVQAAGYQMLALIENRFYPGHATVTPETIATAAADLAIGAEAETHLELTSGGAQGSLLIVDDNEANRDVLSRQLVRQGYVVAVAGSGQKALEMVRANAFDLILLDVMMPEMDGYEVLQRLKSDHHLQHIPVVMISALNELDSVAHCIDMGAEDFLHKPFHATLLKARVGASLENKRARDREIDLYERLQQNYKRLEELEQQRDDLTHMIIHDLRTPLTSVIAAMQTLDVVGDVNNGQREVMEIALTGAGTLLAMINDLLDVEKLEAGSMLLDIGEVCAGDLVSAAVAQVASLAASKPLGLIEKVAGGLPTFRGDESKLRRTLVNLLGNAIKFTPPDGTVTVEARFSPSVPWSPSPSISDPLISSVPHASLILFSVSDTGEGIPSEAFGRIFEKFGQVESRKSGRKMSTGLGLTFCKLAVESHGGHIDVESTPGQGSTFSFTIPL